MTKTKIFFLNGQEYYSEGTLSLLNVLQYFNYNLSLIVLEHNNFICPKQNWSKIQIKNDDIIEVVTIVGGG